MTKTNGTGTWLRQNAWNLITTAGMIIVGCATFYTLTNYRLTKAEEALAEYPSYDYFELRFSQIEENQLELKRLLVEHLNK